MDTMRKKKSLASVPEMTAEERQARTLVGRSTKKELEHMYLDIWKTNKELRTQMDGKLETSEEYQNMVKQLHDEAQLKQIAVKQKAQSEQKVRKLEDECKELRQQLEDLQTDKSLPDATETAQNTADNMSDGQATDDSETAQNGTQGGTEAIAEPLPENISDKIRVKLLKDQLKYITEQLQESQHENASLAERYNMLQIQYNNLQLTPLIAGIGNIDLITDQFIEREKKLQSEIEELKKEKEKANQRVIDFKSKDYGLDLLNKMIKEADNLSQSLKDKQSELEAAEMAQNTLKSNLNKLRAEYQQATRHNARGAGRKPEHTEQLERIMELHAQGLSHRAISEIVKVPSATVGRYIKQMNQK